MDVTYLFGKQVETLLNYPGIHSYKGQLYKFNEGNKSEKFYSQDKYIFFINISLGQVVTFIQ